jgi:hypothetical protein
MPLTSLILLDSDEAFVGFTLLDRPSFLPNYVVENPSSEIEGRSGC